MSRTARLPEAECVYLVGLPRVERNARARELAAAGWSLAAIGDAFSPPKTRSTVKAWITPRTTTLSSSDSSADSADSSQSTLVTAESSRPVPRPEDHAPASAAQAPRRGRRLYDPRTPVMSPDERKKIRELAPIARRYRARANPSGVFARANSDLTAIAVDLYNRGASIRELAAAAGVTYRAMARRVGREDGNSHEDTGE